MVADQFEIVDCGGYGIDGLQTKRDAIYIPSLTEAGALLGFSNLCGQGGLRTMATAVTTVSKTLCCK
jgi:hypothetical protein